MLQRNQSIQKRHFERFNVLSVPEIKVKMSHNRGSWLLVCLGQGGCGFFTPIKNIPKHFPEDIRMTFDWPGMLIQPIEAIGKLVYFVRKHLENQSVWYVGFEFSNESLIAVEPLIYQLERLNANSEVETFLR